VDGEVCEMEGLGGLVRCGLTTVPHEELAEAPAYEAAIGVEQGEAVRRIEVLDLVEKAGSLRAGAGQGSVDRTEDRREGLGAVEVEEPASHLSARRADGQQVEELLVLLGGAVCGEQIFQRGGIEVLVLHAFLLASYSLRRKIA
jgi:hypothetical protein